MQYINPVKNYSYKKNKNFHETLNNAQQTKLFNIVMKNKMKTSK